MAKVKVFTDKPKTVCPKSLIPRTNKDGRAKTNP